MTKQSVVDYRLKVTMAYVDSMKRIALSSANMASSTSEIFVYDVSVVSRTNNVDQMIQISGTSIHTGQIT